MFPLISSAYREIGSKYVSSEIHECHSCVCTSEDITSSMGSNTYEHHFEISNIPGKDCDMENCNYLSKCEPGYTIDRDSRNHMNDRCQICCKIVI